jgi:LCP family protein required for cell wall assembly
VKRPWRTALRAAAALAAAVLLLGAGTIGYFYHSAKTAVDRMYVPRTTPVYRDSASETVPQRPGTVPAAAGQEPAAEDRQAADRKGKRPFTVALLGVDRRAHDTGRSDTIIVMAVNPARKSIFMFSIPRDTRTEIVGKGTTDKINHAFAFGGVDMSLRTIENFLDYPIDYYVQVDMEGFSRIIDLLGGVEVNNPFAFSIDGYSFDKGRLKLTGEQALMYSRMRYDDPRGDLGRNARQRDLIAALLRKSARVSSLLHSDSLLAQLEKSVRTNMKFDFIQSCLSYRVDRYDLSIREIRGTGKLIGGIWYYLVDDGERRSIHEALRGSMETG